MKNNSMNKMKKTMKKSMKKSNVLVEMAEDFKDLITNAKVYKKLTKKKYYIFQYGPSKSRAIFIN